MNLKTGYRSDIDGLRAIAVLSVLFYHAGIKLFSGGYVGVDVFFVISGYLITGIIVKEIQANNFSLVKFYERRIRRIYPAVFAVIFFTIMVSAVLYSAADYAGISKSAISITFFLSNMFFWSESGYFEGASTIKPLLHTWSLSIEEQFYIIFPLLLIFIARFFKSRFKLSVTIMLLASLAAGIYSVYAYESAAFYFMPLRAWELLTGSMLSLIAVPTRIPAGIRNLLSITGVGLILTSVFLFTNDTLFPGIAAVVPVLGTALVIFAGMEGTSLVGSILSLRPIAFIGQISYSLYLWHWPLIVIGKYYLIRKITTTDIAILLAVTFIVSILSWKLIENPFRERKFLKTSQIYALAGTLMFLSFVTSLAIYTSNGFPQRFPSDLVSANGEAEWAFWGKCVTERIKSPPPEVSLCTVGLNTAEPSFLVWGDSHLQALAPGINDSAASAKVNGYVSIMPGCPPLLGIDRPDQYAGTCSTYNDMVVNYIQMHPQLKTIILVGRWAISANGTRFRAEEGATVKLVDTWTDQKGQNSVMFDLGLNRTVAKLLELNRNVVIVTGVPEIGYDVPSSFAIASHTGRDLNAIIAPARQLYLNRNRLVMSTINKIASDDHIQLINPSDVLCDKQVCYVVKNNQPLYRDDDHLSPFGSHYISHIFDPVFENLPDH